MNFYSCFSPELYEIFLSRAKERWKSFSETSSENDVEGGLFLLLIEISQNPGAEMSVIFYNMPGTAIILYIISFNVNNPLNRCYYTE